MRAKQNRVRLSQKQQKQLKKLTRSGVTSARKLNRARVLLLSDEARASGRKSDPEIADILGISTATVGRTRQQFCQEGLEAALQEKARSGRPKEIKGLDKAKVTALACSTPPSGHGRWTLRLLADKAVELEYVSQISHQSVQRLLKENDLKPHLKSQWCIGKLSPLFLWQMEHILELYQQPYDPQNPLWCFDERPCQLLGDTLVPIPMKPGKKWRYDHHYERKGTCNLLIAFQPHTGQRVVQVTQRRTAKDYARFMIDLKAVHNPQAHTLQIVQDNLNTHQPSSFYTLLPPTEALAMAKNFQMHYTPTNGSWLNMVEIELSVIARQCLDRRIDSMALLEREVMALVQERNAAACSVNWLFTPELARQKFQRFYPELDPQSAT